MERCNNISSLSDSHTLTAVWLLITAAPAHPALAISGTQEEQRRLPNCPLLPT